MDVIALVFVLMIIVATTEAVKSIKGKYSLSNGPTVCNTVAPFVTLL